MYHASIQEETMKAEEVVVRIYFVNHLYLDYLDYLQYNRFYAVYVL